MFVVCVWVRVFCPRVRGIPVPQTSSLTRHLKPHTLPTLLLVIAVRGYDVSPCRPSCEEKGSTSTLESKSAEEVKSGSSSQRVFSLHKQIRCPRRHHDGTTVPRVALVFQSQFSFRCWTLPTELEKVMRVKTCAARSKPVRAENEQIATMTILPKECEPTNTLRLHPQKTRSFCLRSHEAD